MADLILQLILAEAVKAATWIAVAALFLKLSGKRGVRELP